MSPRVTPKVSVVISAYNHARYLQRRIDSVLGQTYQDFELILLDGCSTDDSPSILSKYADDPRVRIELNAVNSGSPFKQWNKGVQLARGNYIWIAESDDYADERLLEKLVPLLDGEPSMALAYCRSWRILADGQIIGLLDCPYTDLDPQRWTANFCADGREECQDYLVQRNTIPNAAAGLMSLEDFSANQKNNAALFELYQAQIASVPALRLLAPSEVSFSNYQYAVCMVDEGEFGISRDLLIKLLKTENVVARRYFHPGAHRTVPYSQEFPQFVESLPNTDAVCASAIQFPIRRTGHQLGHRQSVPIAASYQNAIT